MLLVTIRLCSPLSNGRLTFIKILYETHFYLTENTVRAHYKDQLVKAVLGKNWWLSWEMYKHVSALCQRSAGFCNVTLRDTCRYQFALNG
jgi:hypothetical protein